MFNIKISGGYKDASFILILTLALLITITINVLLGIESVYTHLFYIPIILAGMWYHKKAVYIAVFLGIIHVLANYSLYHALTLSPFIRAAFFIFIAYTIGTIVENKDAIFSKLKASEDYLRNSEEKYRQLVTLANECIITIDSDFVVTFANPYTVSLLGYELKEIVGQPIFSFLDSPSRETFSRLVKDGATSEPAEHVALEAQDGKRIFASVKLSRIDDGRGALSILVLLSDITNRVKQQELLNTSLHEKEALLKEIHHRVKNNLQIISSLVNLQSSEIRDNRAISALNETQARIKTMAMIHEKMYRSMDLANIDLGEYVANLTRALFNIYNAGQSGIRLNLNLEKSLQVDIDTAVPCGLIVNELVSNCLKHAFTDGRQGEITVDLTTSEKRALLTVKDNGVGIPADLDIKNTGTLGMQLVYTLAEQLEGTVTIDSTNGTIFKIDFPVR